jgi:hypothetical protein
MDKFEKWLVTDAKDSDLNSQEIACAHLVYRVFKSSKPTFPRPCLHHGELIEIDLKKDGTLIPTGNCAHCGEPCREVSRGKRKR